MQIAVRVRSGPVHDSFVMRLYSSRHYFLLRYQFTGRQNNQFITRYMWPEGTWQRLRRCPKTTGGDYIHFLTHVPIPDRCRPQQPTGYHTVLVGNPHTSAVCVVLFIILLPLGRAVAFYRNILFCPRPTIIHATALCRHSEASSSRG